jgi:transposase
MAPWKWGGQIVATIQELRQGQRVAVRFAAASPWTKAPYVQRGGFRPGQQVKVPGPAKRQSTPLFGALHLRPQQMYGKRAPCGTSTRFIAFLHQRHQRFADALILLILDKAKIHKSRLVKRCVQQHDGIALEHLEPSSPEYHPIERFWKWLKAKVSGATAFDTIEDVLSTIRHMIWHSHEGGLTSTMHFAFEPYQEILSAFVLSYLWRNRRLLEQILRHKTAP